MDGSKEEHRYMAQEPAQIDQAADCDLRRRVQNLLSGQVCLRPLQVDVINGVVFLSGTVRTVYEKQLAIEGCQRVAGVRSVENQVDIAAE
jgi:osmotically-inducible protein OsmY